MTHAIGGFFGMEPMGRTSAKGPVLAFSTGRAALRAILEHARPRRVLLPWWICDSVLQPLRRLGIPWSWYALDAQLIPLVSAPGPDEMVLVVDRFGLQSALMQTLAGSWGARLIVDATQAWYSPPPPGAWWFASARKFFGVPDGALVEGPDPVPVPSDRRTPDPAHLRLRAQGRVEEAYPLFQAAESALDDRSLRCSADSQRIMDVLDHAALAARRRANFLELDRLLGDRNALRLALPDHAVPMAYPFLPAASGDRSRLDAQRIYVPRLWSEVLDRPAPDWERRLSSDLLPLPCDQRYGAPDMARVARIVSDIFLTDEP